jgi:glycosyltransferase involved in cell wall biosynthesis
MTAVTSGGAEAAPLARIMLVLMVRNEERILRRCLEAACPSVDALLLADTGSDDGTVQVARTFEAGLPTKVVEHAWQDFGHNRSLSFGAALAFADELGWPLQESWALVLDADMLLRDAGDLRATLAEPCRQHFDGFTLVQRAQRLEYSNVRLMRLSKPWRCVGVTHEYWGGPGEPASLEGPWIDDVGDGGCKADKFERDKRLLLQGLEAEPTNERYMFYLAQTYHCLQQHREAIEWYERRIAAGGWFEEVWYAHYMITKSYTSLGDVPMAEVWAQRGLGVDPNRTEALLHIIKHLREVSDHFKAWHYLRIAERCRRPKEALFLETDAYEHRLQYEKSILHYYVSSDRGEGLEVCLNYEGPEEWHVLRNASFYAQRLEPVEWKRLTFPVPEGFHSSSVSVNDWGLMCVRAVSYYIQPDGSYDLDASGRIVTRNFACHWNPGALAWGAWREASVPSDYAGPRQQDTIVGLEDVRLQGLRFTATTREYSYCGANRMVLGSFPDMATMHVLRPPHGETSCEKNWLPLDDGRLIYQWHPFEAGAVDETTWQLRIDVRHETPAWFRHVRGSSSPCSFQGRLWCLVHVVCPSSPRQYLHAFVTLEPETLRPDACSRPFYLRHLGIEYCLGMQIWSTSGQPEVQLFTSVWDRESWVGRIPLDACLRMLQPLAPPPAKDPT